jgi:hypothetical protein
MPTISPHVLWSQIYTKMAYFQESRTWEQLFYVTGLVCVMCLSLRNVFGTTMLTMLGPGKALRGPDGSMHSAVDGMLDAFEGIIRVQHLSIYVFIVTVFFYSWGAASNDWLCSVSLSALLAGITYTMIIRTRYVYRSFPLLSIPLVSGAFFKPTDPNTAAFHPGEAASEPGAAPNRAEYQRLGNEDAADRPSTPPQQRSAPRQSAAAAKRLW